MSSVNFHPLSTTPVDPAQASHYPQNEQHHSRDESHELEDRSVDLRDTNYLEERTPGFVSDETLPGNAKGNPAFISSTDDRGTYHHINSSQQLVQFRQQKRLNVLQVWWREALSCVLFLGALLAIVATLHPYQDRPIPDWPYHLSINTLIAIYIVILKAAIVFVAAEGLGQLKWQWFDSERPLKDLLRYDDATRGPWGSFKLLYTLGLRQLVASCGAFIVLAAIIVDPFAQQIIATYNCPQLAESVLATVPRTNNYNETGRHTGAGEASLSLGMQNAINGGIFNPGDPVNYQCPTGNCTFSKHYHTVGFCGNCSDTTNQLYLWNKPNNKNSSTAWILELMTNKTYPLGPYKNTTAYLNGSLADGGSEYLVINSGGFESDIILSYGGPHLNTTSCGSCSTFDLFDEKKANACIDDWDSLSWGCGYLGNTTAWTPDGYGIGAARCSILPCVRTYTAYSEAGKFHESLISEATEWAYSNLAGVGSSSMVAVDCLSFEDRDSLTSGGYEFEGKSFIPYNISIDPYSGNYTSPDLKGNANVTKGAVNRDCIYEYGGITMNSIGEWLGTYLSGNITPGLYSYDFRGSAQLQAIYNESRMPFSLLNDTWQNIADSMTTYVRQHGAKGWSKPATGIALREETCIHVRWPWLAYPAVLAGLALIFFSATVIKTSQGDARSQDWKSNPLALTLHGLDLNGAGREATRERQMEDLAAITQVRLGQTTQGYRFIQTRDGGTAKTWEGSSRGPSPRRPPFRDRLSMG
ncbi:MAG: hypothetical protein Q9227_008694 [Pyrenula ochraceoflavens]